MLERLGVLAIGITVVLGSCVLEARAQGSPRDALAGLNALQIKGRAPRTGYSRALFGTGWKRKGESGCDTRNIILQRDMVSEYTITRADNCTVEIGQLVDPYSGVAIWFEKGVSSGEVEIDHVVSLSNAWQTGAFRWSDSKRASFYHDPHNLLAVKGLLNSQKGDGDAATWLPPKRSYRCEFVARQIAVKFRYALWVTPPEADAMRRILAKCPGQPLPE